jgi:hypothetical protein
MALVADHLGQAGRIVGGARRAERRFAFHSTAPAALPRFVTPQIDDLARGWT